MSRFTSSKTVDKVKGSGKLTVLTSANCDEALLKKSAGALKDSVWLLQRSIAAIGAKHPAKLVVRYAHRYFLTDPKMLTAGDVETIKTILTMTLNGLKSDTTLKVGDLGVGTLGAVTGKFKPASKPYHNSVIDMDDGELTRQGAMKISNTVLSQGRLGVVTLIHEATHKFAGTSDYCYFDDNSVDPDGDFDSKDRALQNADSYAYFALKTGRSWNPLAPTMNSMFS